MISFIYARGYCTRLIEYIVCFKMTVDEVLEKNTACIVVEVLCVSFDLDMVRNDAQATESWSCAISCESSDWSVRSS